MMRKFHCLCIHVIENLLIDFCRSRSAYEIYANLGPRQRSEEEKAKFKATFSRKHARVHFLGVW